MRGSVKIVLGGKEKSLRPAFDAYDQIEERLGPLRQVYTSVVTGTATLQAMAHVVYVGMSQIDDQLIDARTGTNITEEAIAQRLYDAGPWSDDVIGPISDFVAALGWTPDQRKKIAAEVEKQEAL